MKRKINIKWRNIGGAGGRSWQRSDGGSAESTGVWRQQLSLKK